MVILLTKLSQICPLTVLSGWLLCLLICSLHSLIISLLFGIVWYSRLILYGPCPALELAISPRSPSSFYWRMIFILKFINFWLHWVFTAAHGLSLVVARRDCSSLCVDLLQWRPLLQSAGSRGHWLQWSQLTVLVAPQHVGSSLTRDWICVPCISRQILKHWTTREVQRMIFRNQDMGSTCIH